MADRPLILVTNDDGIHARGLQALIDALEPLGDLWVVAPEVNQTAVGRAISINRALRAHPLGNRRFAVDGTPTDCVYLGVCELLPRAPDLVASGINRGNNLADDVFYSGTVGAAIEGCAMGIPSFAVSLEYNGDDAFAGRLASHLAAEILERGLPRGTLLNMNVPCQAAPDWRVRVAPLGKRDYRRAVERREDPRGRLYYWLGSKPISYVPIEGSDCDVVARGDVSLTALRPEITAHDSLTHLKTWRMASLTQSSL